MKIGIAMIAWKRQGLTRKVLASLPLEAPVYLSMEPGSMETVFEITNSTHPDIELSINQDRLGMAENAKKALRMAYDDGCDFVLFVEDDTVLMPSAWPFVTWAAENLQGMGSISCYSLITKGWNHGDVIIQNWFGCTTWGTWRDNLASMLEDWSDDPKAYARNVAGWHLKHGKQQAYPAWSRSLNIGWNAEGSMNSGSHKAPEQRVMEWNIETEYRIAHRPSIRPHWDSSIWSDAPMVMLAASWIENEAAKGWELMCGQDFEKSPWPIIGTPPVGMADALLFDAESLGSEHLRWLDMRLKIGKLSKVSIPKITPEIKTILKRHKFALKYSLNQTELWTR